MARPGRMAGESPWTTPGLSVVGLTHHGLPSARLQNWYRRSDDLALSVPSARLQPGGGSTAATAGQAAGSKLAVT